MRQPHLTSPNTSISELSEDIIRQIFLFLRGCDLAKYAPLVCTEWARICRDDTLWRTRYELEFGFCKLDTYHAGWMERYVSEWSWRHGCVKVSCSEELPGHVIGLLYEDVRKTVQAWSPDGIQKKWSLNTKECIETVHVTRMISCMDFDGTDVIIGCHDGRIELWCSLQWHCKQVLQGHESYVVCLKNIGSVFVSGSVDGTLRIWEKASGVCNAVLEGHSGTVLCIASSKHRIVSGASDLNLRIWDTSTWKCCGVLEGHTKSVSCVDFEENIVVSGSHDGSIRVWDILTMSCIQKLVGHCGVVLCVQLSGRRFISGASDCLIKVWDRYAGECVRTLSGHNRSVSCLVFDERRIISGSNDGVIKVWDVYTRLSQESVQISN